MRRSVWVCGDGSSGRCRCAAEHMEARTSGSLRACACVCLLGRDGRLAVHISVCEQASERASERASKRVHVCVCVFVISM